MKNTALKSTTVKLKEPTNELLERYLGWLRMSGNRLSKEEALAQFVDDGVRAKLPPALLKEFEKSNSSDPAVSARKRASAQA